MAADSPVAMLNAMLQPWREAVEDPARAQADVLQRLLADYAKTDHGRKHHAASIATLPEYRRQFPAATYDDYKPLIQRVMAGEIGLLLCEEPIGWAITRGTTRASRKFIPMTPTDLRMRVSAGRAMMNYVVDSGRFDLFAGRQPEPELPVGGRHGDGRRAARSSTATARASTPSTSRPCTPHPLGARRRTRSTPWAAARPARLGGPLRAGLRRSARRRTSRWSGAWPRRPCASGATCTGSTASIRRTCGRRR